MKLNIIEYKPSIQLTLSYEEAVQLSVIMGKIFGVGSLRNFSCQLYNMLDSILVIPPDETKMVGDLYSTVQQSMLIQD